VSTAEQCRKPQKRSAIAKAYAHWNRERRRVVPQSTKEATVAKEKAMATRSASTAE